MHRGQFLLDPEVTYLNHGSFGACPRSVLHAQHELRLAMERMVMLDAITSASAWVLPIETWVSELQSQGIDCLVDGAHAVGQIPLDLDALGAAYYTSNAHKWLCAPKGCAFLYARADRRERLKPVVISHGGGGTRDRNQLHLDFDWTGTADPTAYLTLPQAIEAMQGFLPGGLVELQKRNRDLALHFRRRVQQTLGFRPTGCESMVGSMVSFVVPNRPQNTAVLDPLTKTMRKQGVELAAFPWSAEDCRLVRLSAQIYNEEQDVERFIEAWPRG